MEKLFFLPRLSHRRRKNNNHLFFLAHATNTFLLKSIYHYTRKIRTQSWANFICSALENILCKFDDVLRKSFVKKMKIMVFKNSYPAIFNAIFRDIPSSRRHQHKQILCKLCFKPNVLLVKCSLSLVHIIHLCISHVKKKKAMKTSVGTQIVRTKSMFIARWFFHVQNLNDKWFAERFLKRVLESFSPFGTSHSDFDVSPTLQF